MPDDPRTRLRAICLALPEAEERETWGDPTWRVRDRIFAMEKRGDGRISVWLKAPPGAQDVLVTADPARFFVPPYVGHRGWIGVRLDAAPRLGRTEGARRPQLPPHRPEAPCRQARSVTHCRRTGPALRSPPAQWRRSDGP